MAVQGTPPSEVSLNLALAVIASSTAPLLLLDGDLAVIAASGSFCRAFKIDPLSVAGHPLSGLGGGEWNGLQLASLLKATVAGHTQGEAYEMDLRRDSQATRRLVLNAQKLNYGDTANVRLLLAVSDVTDARLAEKLKDDMLREKAILLQELQHRVANSLQIIASVLMQSARRVNSDETRSHLHAAHNRVMSVAAVQKQLAASSGNDVGLRAYFGELCRSLGASMIHDHDQLSLEVTTDETVASSNVTISLGLIVTELVINALKHAFPGDRRGKIIVGYRSESLDWTLSVSDNGVGISKVPQETKPGLGTSIVQALANQLDAEVNIAAAFPGTRVSVVHATVALH